MIVVECEEEFGLDIEQVRGRVERTIQECKGDGNYGVNIVICGAETMKELHYQYMVDQGYVEELHDVLSFPTEDTEPDPDGVLRLGDIAVCFPVATQQASEAGKPVQEEVEFLACHGTMHLMGVHHD